MHSICTVNARHTHGMHGICTVYVRYMHMHGICMVYAWHAWHMHGTAYAAKARPHVAASPAAEARDAADYEAVCELAATWRSEQSEEAAAAAEEELAFAQVSAWYVHGICMAYAWYMHGICMVYAWYMHGICMVYAAHPPPAPRLHRCAHDPLRHRHILPASRARLGLPTAHGARLVFRLGAQDPHNSNPNPNPNPNPKP